MNRAYNSNVCIVSENCLRIIKMKTAHKKCALSVNANILFSLLLFEFFLIGYAVQYDIKPDKRCQRTEHNAGQSINKTVIA